LNGSVHDSSGAVVANADVDVSNPSLGINRKLKTNEDGLFFAPSLTPAEGYTVTVTMAGFAGSKTANVAVHVGEQVTIPVVLAVGSVTQQVEVTTSQPAVDITKTEISTLISHNQIQNLPINGRRVDQFSLLSPGVVPDSTSGELSFHGIPSGNQFLQDGVDITQQWSIQNAGGPAVVSNISQDAVQEFRTEILGYSAEFGRGSGGVLNTLTKSGTNAFHGTLFEFFRNQSFNATDRFSKLNGQPYNAPELRNQFGGTIGGPIMQNKLFVFGSYEGTKRNYPLVDSILNPAILDSTTHQLLPSVCVSAPAPTPSAAQCAAVQKYLDRFFTTVDRHANQNAFFTKLDWRPNGKATYTLNFNLVNYFAFHGLSTDVANTFGGGVGTNGDVATHVRNLRFSHTYLLNGSMVNEFRFGYNADRRAQGLATDLLPPNGLLSALTVQGQGSLGVSTNQLPNKQPTEARFDLSDNFSQSHGAHELKYGLDIAYLRSVENGIFNGPGAYTYSLITQFAFDLTPTAGDPLAGKRWATYAQALGHPITRITIRDYDFFAQDVWRVSRPLTLNLGLRYEFATFTQPPLNPDYPATAVINQPKWNFAPRIGFTYAMNRDRTVVHGNYGIFYNRLPGATITRLQQLGGVVRRSFTMTPSTVGAPTFPNRLTSLSEVSTLTPPNAGFAKPGLATPYVQEVTFGVQQDLGHGMSLDVSYAMGRGLKFLQRSDLNAGPAVCCDTFNLVDLSGATTGTFSTPVYLAANRVDKRYVRVLQIDNAGRTWYDGLLTEMRIRRSQWLQGSVAYTFSHAIDLSQGVATSNYYFSDQGGTYFNGISIINGRSGYSYEKGSALEDLRHRLVMTAVASLPQHHYGSNFADQGLNGWQLAPIFTLASPQHVNSLLTVGTPDSALAFTTPTLSGIGGETPGGSRVPFLPTANLPLGKTVQLDARLSKVFRLPKEQSLEFGFEAINVLNHFRFTGVSTTAYRSVYTATTKTITAQPGLGTPTASAGYPDGTNARRAQVMFRYTF